MFYDAHHEVDDPLRDGQDAKRNQRASNAQCQTGADHSGRRFPDQAEHWRNVTKRGESLTPQGFRQREPHYILGFGVTFLTSWWPPLKRPLKQVNCRAR
jgi:hypothetical protein